MLGKTFLLWITTLNTLRAESLSISIDMTLSTDVSSEVPPHSDEIKVSFPGEHVLLLTLNRPRSLNAVTPTLNNDLTSVLRWFDDEPSLWYIHI